MCSAASFESSHSFFSFTFFLGIRPPERARVCALVHDRVTALVESRPNGRLPGLPSRLNGLWWGSPNGDYPSQIPSILLARTPPSPDLACAGESYRPS